MSAMVSGAEGDLLSLLSEPSPVDEEGLDTGYRHHQAGQDHYQDHQGQGQAVRGEGGDVELGDDLVCKNNLLVADD